MELNSELKPTGDESSSRLEKLKVSWVQHRLIYFTVFGITFLLVFILSAFALISRLAQGQVDDSIISLIDIKFLKPTSNSLLLTQSASLYSKSRFTPTLDPSSASIYLVKNGTYSPEPFSTIELPKIHVQNPSSTLCLEDVVINFKSDQACNQIADFALHLLTEETVTTAMVGSTMLNLGLLPQIKVDFNKTTSFKGLNGLKDFNVTDVKMNLTAAPGDPNLSSMASIPNPSIITTDMGNITFVLSTEIAGVVGHSEIRNCRLAPGSNTFLMISYVNQTKIAESLDRASGTVELSVAPVSTVFEGQRLIFFEKAFAANKFSLQLNVEAILANS
ncbi:hypothetical protein K3495_g2580 [Podosphaera aphanis]|nr:hypothetical protein K3495_g2580 [Podosphaera aphanis]